MSCALQEWLPQGHLAYFINDTVGGLDLHALHARYAGGGLRNQPFHPGMMVKVLVYGYASGVFMGRVKLGTIAVGGTKIKANASRHKAMSYGRMRTTEIELKAQIAALLKKANSTDEAEKDGSDLDIPAWLKRRQARLAAIEAAKARLEERLRQADAQRGRSDGDACKPENKNGKPRGGKPHQRDFGVPSPKAQDSFTDPQPRIMKRAGRGFD